MIAYNFGEAGELEVQGKNYDNEIELFDDTLVHQIEVGLSAAEYEQMVTTYQELGEKEFFRTYVIIDGVIVPDVGVRLKGNLTLRQTLGGEMDVGGRPAGEDKERERPDFQPPEGFQLPEGLELSEGMERPEGFGPGGMSADGNGDNPPLLIKFDEFTVGQTYQGLSEMAVRIGSDKALLNEALAFYLHREAGQVVPETAYAAVSLPDNETSLYLITEHPDENYLKKYFNDKNGILYKVANFTGFEYLGEDPTLYAEKYEQKTSVNDDDMVQLIKFMRFVSESSDEEFEEGLADWLELDSFVRMMALDNLLSNNDSFVGMGSNYYLYYNKETAKFTMLSWDQNLAMGGMGGGMGREGGEDTESRAKREEIMQKWLEEGGFGGEENAGDQQRKGGMQGNTNTLKERFFANEYFSELYNEEYARLKQMIFTDGLALEKTEELAEVFTSYNKEQQLMEQSEYDSGVEKMRNFITSAATK